MLRALLLLAPFPSPPVCETGIVDVLPGHSNRGQAMPKRVILCVPCGLLVLGLTALSPPRADRGDVCL
jgi:hypothetical protein